MSAQQRILSVDDSDFIRQIITRVLNEAGYEVVEADSAEKALEILKEDTNFQLALLDINMPGMDGLVLAKKILRELALPEIEVCMLTTESDKHYLSRAFDLGIEKWLLKPFKPEELLAMVKEALEARKSA